MMIRATALFRTMMQLDDEMIQEAMNNMKQAFAENGRKFGMEKLSFEAVERWIYENRSTAQQAIRAQQEKASTRGGTTRTRGEAVQRRAETNHD